LENNCKSFDGQNKIIRKEIEELEENRQHIFDLHQSGVYDDTDFTTQKKYCLQKIAQKESLIHDKRNPRI